MSYPILQRELTVHLNNGHWYLRPIKGTDILGPVDYGWHRYNLYPDSFTFGQGLLAGSSIPGSRRLVFCAWSPQWESFYVSSMGGAASTFHGVGVDYVALRGRCETPSVLLLNHKDGEVRVRLEPVEDLEALWMAGYNAPDGRLLIGFYALQQALFDRYAHEYHRNHLRIFALGPASLHTREGAIGSSPYQRGALSPVVDWAGRGGLGSQLLQNHNVVACVLGGEWEDPDLRDSDEINAYFVKHFGDKLAKVDRTFTQKYKYFPKFETGGTFGVNMHQLYDRILSFNYGSIYVSADERLRQHDQFIVKHYLEQFNTETIATKSQKDCGETCPVVCKKMNGIYKKDYEPYHVLGPQTGVFDQRAAEILNDHVDAMGFDAIQCGGTLSWIMEIIAAGLIPPEDFGFPPAREMNFTFASDTEHFDLVEDSMRNARYALALVEAILSDPRCEPFRRGIRPAAHELDRCYGVNTLDRAVFIAHGEEGHMVPNQYWVPGMFSPMPLMGKYYVYYGSEFVPPYELGRKNVERMTYELFNDNTGICRFHRQWAESLTDEILMAHYALDVDYKAHQFALAKAVHEREAAKGVPWESERMADLLLGFLENWRANGLRDATLDLWLERFQSDKKAAALEFWLEIYRGQAEAFARGPQAIPDMLTPGQMQQTADAATADA
jgi:glyceraldehyde-3-phosphate dehydrogenase (ferredoxin)